MTLSPMRQTSDDALKQASTLLLTPGGLDVESLNVGLGHAMGVGIDYADLFFQRTWHEMWVLEDGEVKETAGKVTGDKETETEGKLQQAEGKIKEVAEDAKDAIKGAVNHLKGDK